MAESITKEAFHMFVEDARELDDEFPTHAMEVCRESGIQFGRLEKCEGKKATLQKFVHLLTVVRFALATPGADLDDLWPTPKAPPSTFKPCQACCAGNVSFEDQVSATYSYTSSTVPVEELCKYMASSVKIMEMDIFKQPGVAALCRKTQIVFQDGLLLLRGLGYGRHA